MEMKCSLRALTATLCLTGAMSMAGERHSQPVESGKRIVLIAGTKSHGPGDHEYDEVDRILKTNNMANATEDRAMTLAESDSADLWSHDNLLAWCAVPFDAKRRGPEDRAQMLARLGFKHFAYDWREKDIPTFDAEIEALKKYNVNLLAWWFPLEADNPLAKQTLEVFKRQGVQPQLWVVLGNTPRTPQDQTQRVPNYADRIAALYRLAVPYGVKIGLYNHNDWFGMVDNQLAIIERLKQMGVNDVGIVYNFSHARDDHHDDSKNFYHLWQRMKAYVMAVNVTGMRWEGELVYPSQGDSELEMMRIIQQSGWKGPVGLIAEKGGDAEVTLANYIKGLDWLAAELKRPGYGGPKPEF